MEKNSRKKKAEPDGTAFGRIDPAMGPVIENEPWDAAEGQAAEQVEKEAETPDQR